MKLIVTRHGQTEWNVKQMTQGVTDTQLTRTGVQQAQRLAQRLRGQNIQAVYTSPLQRAAVTADICAEALGLFATPDARLREYCFGLWEGKLIRRLAIDYPEHYRQWVSDPVQLRLPDAEDYGEYSRRMAAFLRDIYAAHADDNVLVVAHSQTVKLLVVNALELPERYVHRIRIDNTSLTILAMTEGRARLETLNDTRHLWEWEL